MPLIAPTHWRSLDFISDLHLQASAHATFAAWQRYMATSTADAVFILGDLFEVWVGDDITRSTDADGVFARQCQTVLRHAAQRMAVYFMHGNRDFLLGETFASGCKMRLVPDPTALDFDGQRWLLSHGDTLCLGDTDYQQFRNQVRTPDWCTAFLAKPLTERHRIARQLRTQSEAHKTSAVPYADVDHATALQWLVAAQASGLIHGHTHQPADHLLETSAQPPLYRRVLSDWDASARPPRLQVLRLQSGCAPLRLSLA